MRKIKRFGLFFLVIVLSMSMFLFLGCQPAADTGTESVDLGFIFDITGAGSVLGNMQRDAVTLAVNQINEQGGINIDGERFLINPVFRDSESAPDVGARRVRELARDGVEIIMGGSMAHVSLAMSEIAGDEGVFYMSACAVPSPYFHSDTKSPYSLGILGNAVSVGRSGLTYIMETHNPDKLVFFLPDYAWGHMHEEGARQVLEDSYPNVNFEVVYSPVGTADLTPYLIDVRDRNADVVVMGHWGTDAITALQQADEMGLRDTTEVAFIWVISVFATAVEPSAVEGMEMLTWWHHDMEGFWDEDVVRKSNELVEEWVAAIGEPPDAYAMGAWVGVQEMARGIEISGSLNPEQVYNALMDNPDFDTPKGGASWRIDGTPKFEYWAFVLEGLGPDEREDMQWDFGRVVGGYEGDEFLVPLELLGY